MHASLLTLTILALAASDAAPLPGPMKTSVQTPLAYAPDIDLGVDMIMVYGIGDDFPERAASWRERGYTTAMMTGISWGHYADYYGQGDAFRRGEVQTRSNGELYMHSPGVGYAVPTQDYIDYLKAHIAPAIAPGTRAVFLEEPEFWSLAGWSAGFQEAWEQRYGEPWEPPDSSVAAQYKASALKSEMYEDALRQVIGYVKASAAGQGLDIGCYVPTHSLINYAHWRIVSPQTRLFDIPGLDGLIGQVWTGTAGTGVYYQGDLQSRFFEYALMEYGQLVSMLRPYDAKLWFLADPIEDNTTLTWEHYRRAYEQIVTASLMWPEVAHFEVMPWPGRVFRGVYLSEAADGERTPIPQEYATQLLTVANALAEMPGLPATRSAALEGIGMLVSDTMMFQRSEPHHSDYGMGGVFGLALPLLKAGVFVEPVQLEHAGKPGFLDRCTTLLLTYEHQKPLNPAYHQALAAWVRAGGALLYAEGEPDGYHAVPAWWNEQGQTAATAYDDLFERLGADVEAAAAAPVAVGDGFVRALRHNPKDLQHTAEGADLVRTAFAELTAAQGRDWRAQGFLTIARGPYVAMAAIDEAVAPEARYVVHGRFVDLFDARLPVVDDPAFGPGSYRLLRRVPEAPAAPEVLAASCRIRDQRTVGETFTFTARGPAGTQAVVRVSLPQAPASLAFSPPLEVETAWDDDTGTLLLIFDNAAQDVTVSIE